MNRLIASRAHTRGRTLLELLVAMTLSLMILAGVGAMYLGANQTARVTTNVAAIEDRAQVALDLLGVAIRRAGYAEIIGTQIGTRVNLLYSGNLLAGCTGQRFRNPAAEDMACVNPPAGAVGDAIAVWFQADAALASAQGATEDCVGNVPTMMPVSNIIYQPNVVGGNIAMVRNVYYLDAAGNLMCLGNGSATPQVLVPNVEDFKVYYGFDDVAYLTPTAVGERPAARSLRDAAYLNNLAVGTGVNAWDFVVSAQVCVLVRTPDSGVSVQAANAAMYLPCPQTAAAAVSAPVAVAAPGDGAIRRAYQQVFAVRSRSAPTPATPI